MKDTFLLFQLIAPLRFSVRQKVKFLSFLLNEFRQMGLQSQIARIKLKGRLFRRRWMNHLIVGNLEKAKIVIIAGYDTPTRMIIPRYQYYPLNCEQNQQNEVLNLLIYNGFAIILIVLSYFALFHLPIFAHTNTIVLDIILAILILISVLLGSGIPNRYNFNQNTSSIVVLFELIKNIGNRNEQIAFIFADEYAMSTEGYGYIGQLLKRKCPNCKVIILDCIGSNDFLYFARSSTTHSKFNPENNDNYKELVLSTQTYQKSPLSFFQNCTYITRGTLHTENLSIVDVRNPHDNKVNLENLEILKSLLHKGITQVIES